MKTFSKPYVVALVAGLSALPLTTQAVSISYELFSFGGNQYRYDYTVTNDGSLGAGVAIKLFDIQFDPADYREASLTVVTPAPLSTQWQEDIFPSISSLTPPVPAAYNACAGGGLGCSGSGVADGTSITGFAVQFEWLGGPAGPGSQPYEIYDPTSFDLLATGTTVPQQPSPPPSVPLPGSLYLVGMGLVALAAVRHRR